MAIIIDKLSRLTMALIAEKPDYISLSRSIHDNIHHYCDRFLSLVNRELK